MKQILLALAGVFCINTAQSQEFSYGLVIGGNYYQTNNYNGKSSMSSEGDCFKANLGGYAEYNFTNTIGVKTEITFTNKTITQAGASVDRIPYNFGFIDVSPAFKYDFGAEYRKGFYMTFGPRFSFLTSAKSNEKDVKEAFENMNIGLQLGFGQRVWQYFDIQGKIDGGITPFFEFMDSKSSFFGAYISLNVDLERMINKS